MSIGTGRLRWAADHGRKPVVASLLLRLASLFLVCMVLLLGAVAYWSSRAAIHEAETNAAELTRLVEIQLSRMFEAADVMLQQTADLGSSTDWSDRAQAAAANTQLNRIKA